MKTYFLKHKDLLLAEISCELDSMRIDKVYHKPKLLFMLDSDYNMKYWLSTRQTLINRQNANELFKVASIRFIEDFLDVTMALSLSDCLLVTRDNSIKWSYVSLFINSFNKVLTDITSGLYSYRGVFVKSSVFEKLLEEFEFKNHPKLPLNSERLVMINRLFKKNLMGLLHD